MPLESLKHLYDMQQACRLLAAFIAGKTLGDYSADAMLRSAVERQLTIVGEALNRLKKIDPATVPRSPTHARSSHFAISWSMAMTLYGTKSSGVFSSPT